VVDGFLGLNWFSLKPIPGQGLCYFQTGPETGLPGVVHSFTGYFSEQNASRLFHQQCGQNPQNDTEFASSKQLLVAGLRLRPGTVPGTCFPQWAPGPVLRELPGSGYLDGRLTPLFALGKWVVMGFSPIGIQ
jgi:hypothetical protein